MGIFREIWFWVAVMGIVYITFLGWTSRFINKEGRLCRRNNRQRRESAIYVVVIVVSIATYVETFYRLKHGYHSAVMEIFTEEIFYELFLYMAMYFTTYMATLIMANFLAEAIHIGVFTMRREDEARTKREIQRRYTEELRAAIMSTALKQSAAPWRNQ